MLQRSAAASVQGVLENSPSWHKQDTVWMLSLYGTAIGAGTLFLPINAGLHGIWPLVVMLILAFPMTYFSHRAMCRFVLSGSSNNNITDVVQEHFGAHAGRWLTLLYFFAIYPILLMYSVAITNTTQSFIVNQLGMPSPPRAVLAMTLIVGLMSIIRFGQQAIIKSMSVLVYPFVCCLLLLGCYLMPDWNSAVFDHEIGAAGHDGSGLIKTIWLMIPVMVFSFNHSPIISSFAVSQKQRYKEDADEKSSLILKYSHIMMVVTVMFFVFSCVFSLSPADLALAKAQNISILSYLANHFKSPIFTYGAPVIAFVAIAKSFFGHYLGAREGFHGVMTKLLHIDNKKISDKAQDRLIDAIIVVTCCLAATINPSILGMIEAMGGPVIALLLFLMPMYAIAKVPAMKKYQPLKLSNTFVTAMGLIAVSAIFYGLFF